METTKSGIEGKVTYRFATPIDPKGDILYVNVVPEYSCVNSCRFCSRTDAMQGLPNIYEKKAGANLYLAKAPSVEEVVREVQRNMTRRTKEVAFVGLGEPLLQFELVRDSIAGIRSKGYRRNVRIDTNGLVKNWYGPFAFECLELIDRSPARELKQAGLDEIRISVNATSEEEYQNLCRPRYENVFEGLCEFVRDCIGKGIDTKASFVTDFDDGKVKTRSGDEYRAFASSLGVKPKNVVLRKFVPAIKTGTSH